MKWQSFYIINFNTLLELLMKMHNPFKRFIFCFLSILGSALFFIIGFNLLVDPFGLYPIASIEGLNKIKTEIDNHSRLYKAVAIARKNPQALILGSSRVMGGINPEDLETLTQLPAYNGGFHGATFEEIYHYFEHALYHQPDLKVLVVGLDLFAFRKKVDTIPGFSKERLCTFTLTLTDILSSLFSRQGLASSYQTLKKNRTLSLGPIFLDNGQMPSSIFLDPDHNWIMGKGDLEYLKFMFSEDGDYYDYVLDDRKVQLFEQLVKRCQERQIELKVFVCPCQAIYWEAMYRKQLWPTLETLKKRLCAIYPIWDFSGFNCVTTRLGENQHPFYFDCSHFTPYIGNLILNKMFNKQDSIIQAFGLLLTPATIETGLAEALSERQLWLNKNNELSCQLNQKLEIDSTTSLCSLSPVKQE